MNLITMIFYNNRNTITTLASLKVYNCRDFFRLNDLSIRRIDIENSNALIVNCNISETYAGIEARHNNRSGENVSLDIRSSDIERVRIFINCLHCEIVESEIGHCSFENPYSQINIIFIWQHNTIQKLTIGNRVDEFIIRDSEIRYLSLTSDGFIETIQFDHAHLSTVTGLFESKTSVRTPEACRLIARSYDGENDERNYFLWMYRMHCARISRYSFWSRIPLHFLKYTCGFGYNLTRSLIFSIGTMFLCALVFSVTTWISPGEYGLMFPDVANKSFFQIFLNSIYFSIVSFATLGYGDIVCADIATKLLSSIEAVFGIYTMAIVVFSLTKRYVKE